MMTNAAMKKKKFMEGHDKFWDEDSIMEKKRVQMAVAHLYRCWEPL